MNPEHPAEFDDPGLKEAVRQVWPKTVASPLARQRITELLQRSTAEALGAAARPSLRIHWLAYAAAVMALALAGFIGYEIYEAVEHREYVNANMDRFRRMLEIHAATKNDAPAATDAPDLDTLARQLNRPVASLPTSDVVPIAATIVQFNDQSRVAHVRYGQPHYLSVLSLPASALVDAHDGFRYDIDIDAYQLIGEVRGDNVFCVIADPRADGQSLREIVSRITVSNPPRLP